MTTQFNDSQMEALHSRTFSAIVIKVDQSITVKRASEINALVTEYLETATETDEMMPVFINYIDVGTTELFFPMSYPSPADKAFLDRLLTFVDEAKSYKRVSKFNYREEQFPKQSIKKKSAKKVTDKKLKEEPIYTRLPSLDYLPTDLRFMHCEEAMKECDKIAEIFGRWPFYGFQKDDLRVWTEKLVKEFDDRYPYLAEANRVIEGRLTKVITELGKHPYQDNFDRNSFWLSIKSGWAWKWMHSTGTFLDSIAKGNGSEERYYADQDYEYKPSTGLYGTHASRSSRN